MKYQIHRITAFGILLTMILAFGCKSEVDVDIPDQQPKLVIGGFISPQDSLIVIRVSSSIPLFMEAEVEDFQFDVVENAVVTIDNGMTEVTLPFDASQGYYSITAASFPVLAGSTYTLRVSCPGYESVDAVTTVPGDTPQFSEAVISQVVESGNDWDYSKEYNFDFSWEDADGEENYYCVAIQPTDIFYLQSYDDYYSDAGADGGVIDIDRVVNYYSDPETPVTFRVYLLNTTRDYYLYHRSANNITTGDPFSEPTIVYSNVINGLGCFTSFNGSSVVLEE